MTQATDTVASLAEYIALELVGSFVPTLVCFVIIEGILDRILGFSNGKYRMTVLFVVAWMISGIAHGLLPAIVRIPGSEAIQLLFASPIVITLIVISVGAKRRSDG